MVLKTPLAVVIVLGFLVYKTFANEQNTGKFTKFICTVHDNILITNDSCSTKPIRRNLTVINLRGYFTKPVKDLMINVKIYKKMSVYKPFLVNVKENFCHYFSKESSTPYTKLLYGIFHSYTNLNHSCPYRGEIFIKDLPMDASKLPVKCPAGEYRLDVVVMANKSPNPCVTLQIYVEVGEKVFS